MGFAVVVFVAQRTCFTVQAGLEDVPVQWCMIQVTVRADIRKTTSQEKPLKHWQRRRPIPNECRSCKRSLHWLPGRPSWWWIGPTPYFLRICQRQTIDTTSFDQRITSNTMFWGDLQYRWSSCVQFILTVMITAFSSFRCSPGVFYFLVSSSEAWRVSMTLSIGTRGEKKTASQHPHCLPLLWCGCRNPSTQPSRKYLEIICWPLFRRIAQKKQLVP